VDADAVDKQSAADAALLPRAPRLSARNVVHRFAGQPPVVELASLTIEPGEQVALTGPSGSGKTTLLYLLTGIEAIQRGSVRWGAVELAGLSESRRDRCRRKAIGFVFQEFHLIAGLRIEQNVLVASYFDQVRPSAAQRRRAGELLAACRVPLERGDVAQLSRGEQQRVAIARALLHEPTVIVADEPTASLDAASGAQVIELLTGRARQAGATLLTVSHDPALIDAVGTVYRLDRGRLQRLR
jgi:putative ABC transport system ATP-binding protein